jgi:O-methyltransferase
MHPEDYAKLLDDINQELLRGCNSIAILGLTPVTLQLLASFATLSYSHCVRAIYSPNVSEATPDVSVPVRSFQDLQTAQHDVLIVAADDEKEDLIRAALPYVHGTPKVLVAGYGHLAFRDRLFQQEVAGLLVPSLANGYQNSLIHLYQCLGNAARLGLSGVVAEFGMFKGGTTMFLSRVAERLCMNWKVIGFDTFGGFPPRKTILDMYDHPDCVFTDLVAVRRYLEGRNVEIVVGDIAETCHRLDNEDVVLAFIDTDNFTPAAAAMGVVRERTVIGGSIVFDHFTGDRRFRYTLGERIAASGLLTDPRYFNLHGTGVFYRQR